MTTLWPITRPGETPTVTFDFSDETTAVSNPTVTASLLNQAVADASPGSTVSGTATVVGATVLQRLSARTAQNDYLVTCTATAANGDVLKRDAILPVRDAPA